MRPILRVALSAIVLASLAYACSSSPTAGTEGGACYANGTCNSGLSCLSNLCVKENTDSGVDASSDGAVAETGTDAQGSDAGDGGLDATLTDKDCPDSGDCQGCCLQIHNAGAQVYGNALDDCACDGGACYSPCATTFCQNNQAGPQCQSCLVATCGPAATAACNLDSKCVAWTACTAGCP